MSGSRIIESKGISICNFENIAQVLSTDAIAIDISPSSG